MALQTAKIKIPFIEDDGELTIRVIRICFTDNMWRVIHLTGTHGRNTHVNDIIQRAFKEAQIDYPGGLLAQIDDLQSVSAVNRHNIMLAIALGIIKIMNRARLSNIDEYLVVGGLDINGNIYPPMGISADALANLAASQGLKTLGCTAAGTDRKLDTLVGFVK